MGTSKRDGQFLHGFDAKTPSGIYRITCLSNNRYYVGSSIRMLKRCSLHRTLLLKGKHHCLPLQNSFRKYGEDNFKFEVVLVCRPEDLLFFEQKILDISGVALLNASRLASSTEATPEVRARRSVSAKAQHVRGLFGQKTWQTSAKEKGQKAKQTRLSRGGYKPKPESVAKMKASKAANPWTEEMRAAQRERLAIQRANGQKMHTAWTPEQRAAQSERAKAQGWGNPDA